MSLFQRILDVHTTWMDEKGYNELRLDAAEKAGTLQAQFKDEFGKVINRSLWDDLPRRFSVELLGRFNQKQDRVHFEFSYEYEPQHIKLHLKAMTAVMNDIEQVYTIQHNMRSQLPPCEKVYLDLVQKTRLQAAQPLTAPKRGADNSFSKVTLK
jgi:hypothetical protein